MSYDQTSSLLIFSLLLFLFSFSLTMVTGLRQQIHKIMKGHIRICYVTALRYTLHTFSRKMLLFGRQSLIRFQVWFHVPFVCILNIGDTIIKCKNALIHRISVINNACIYRFSSQKFITGRSKAVLLLWFSMLPVSGIRFGAVSTYWVCK